MMVEFFQHVTLDERVQIRDIGDHACRRIDLPRKADFQNVVMTVPVGIVAFSKNTVIL